MFNLTDKFKAGLSQLKPASKNKNDPLTTLKSTTRWLDSLPGGDALGSQNAILAAMQRFNENLTHLSSDRLAVLCLLDEKSQNLQDTLVQQYLRNSRMSRTIESQLWHAVNSLYWEIARSYHVFITHFSRSAKNHPDEAMMPLITVRAIRTFGLLLKWRGIRYLQPGQRLWQWLHGLYRVAESEGFHRNRMTLYPTSTFTCTCESAYLHILMLDLANSGTLYPRQLHLVDQWLGNWSRMLSLDSTLDMHQHSFAVDLSSDHSARRVRNPAEGKPMRFWGATKLANQLDTIQLALREGLPPAQVGLTEESRVAESIDLLDHLQRQWSAIATREQRRTPRERTKHMVEICHGLNNIVSQIKTVSDDAASPYGDNLPYMEADDVAVYGFVTERTRSHTTRIRALRPGIAPDVERWIMQDESANGYGAVVETRDKSWLRIGALVAAKSREADAWRLGIVRRLFRLDEESSSVGIEIFAESPQIVTLYDRGALDYTVNGQAHNDKTLPKACLWLPEGEERATLVMDPAHYQVDKMFEIHGLPDIEMLALRTPIERSEGWIRVRVEIIRN